MKCRPSRIKPLAQRFSTFSYEHEFPHSAMPLHLCELMWRRRLRPGEDEFDKILQDIALFYPPV
ncbi:hypothetical protein M514_24375 [Trichuris suis]|uniref:Uncharacterized protein n=1 Tax=Trichuris suis TaxID=68888 RepID=A0A085N1V3_9BILA|nr:hypothetical protein M514_24375 [Trichuris suis]